MNLSLLFDKIVSLNINEQQYVHVVTARRHIMRDWRHHFILISLGIIIIIICKLEKIYKKEYKISHDVEINS